MAGLIWAVGDIHGMSAALNPLLDACLTAAAGKIVFVGDYIDRGPDSRSVVDRILTLPVPAISLMGNHDELLLEYIDGNERYAEYPDTWLLNGGGFTAASFMGISPEEGERLLRAKKTFFLEHRYEHFFRTLRLTHVEKFRTGRGNREVAFVHAGFDPSVPLAEWLTLSSVEDYVNLVAKRRLWVEDTILWTRHNFLACDPAYLEGMLVVHGHTPTQTLRLFAPRSSTNGYDAISALPFVRHARNGDDAVSIDIDTGCYAGHRLSAVGFSEEALSCGILPVLQVERVARGVDSWRLIRSEIVL